MIPGDACSEGVLEWVPKAQVPQLPIWEGIRSFSVCWNSSGLFSLKLVYKGDELTGGGAGRQKRWRWKPPSERIKTGPCASGAGPVVFSGEDQPFSFRSPSLIQPMRRSISQKTTLSTAGRTKQISTRPIQSMG